MQGGSWERGRPEAWADGESRRSAEAVKGDPKVTLPAMPKVTLSVMPCQKITIAAQPPVDLSVMPKVNPKVTFEHGSSWR